MGQGLPSGFGLTPITWTELKNFREENELDLTLWERQMLRKMSEAYCSEASLATDPKRPAPYAPVQEEEEVDQIAKAMRFMDTLSAFRKKEN